MSASEFGVVVGVVLEGTEYIPSIHRRWPILEKIGFLLLVLSLVADWHFQSQINERHTNALLSANTRIAELNLKATQLTKDAENARGQIANANERAANAEKEAEGERLETERIKARIAWRALDPTQQASIASKLAPFAGEHADMAWYPETVEAGTVAAKTFAASIESALKAARWTVHNISQMAGSNNMPEIAGVLVLTMPNDQSEKMGKALVNALWPEQVVASVEPVTKYFPTFATVIGRDSNDPYATRVVIVIGNHL